MHRPTEVGEKVIVFRPDPERDYVSDYQIGIFSSLKNDEDDMENFPIEFNSTPDGRDREEPIHKEDIYEYTAENEEKFEPRDISGFDV